MTYDPDQLTMFGDDERIQLLRDDLIRGTQFQDGKLRIEEFVLNSKPDDAELVKFLQKEYGIGGHSGPDQPMVDYDSKGIRIRPWKSSSDYKYTWKEAAKEIRRAIERDEYVTAQDVADSVDNAFYYLNEYPDDEWDVRHYTKWLKQLSTHPKLSESDRTRINAVLGSENKTEKEKSMTQFEIIMRTDTPELPAEIGNFEEVKAAISEALEQYSTDAVVTEETVKDAEKTRAHLRRVKDQVEQYRKDAKAAYLEKFNLLETQCKELSGMIEQPITAIDSKIKEFENAENEKKYRELEVFFASIGAPQWLNIDDVLNPKWKNKTATLTKLRQEISEAVCKIEDDFAEIEKMYAQSPLWTAISDKFKATKDKSSTLVYAAQIERQHSEEQKRAAEIQRQREAEEAARAESAQNAICEPEAPQAVTQPEIVQNVSPAAETAAPQLIRGAFRVEGTKDQIRALAMFLKQNGIRYEVIK